MTLPFLCLQAATLGYPGVAVLHEVDLNFEGGHATAIVGPNGAGKSTLLRSLVGVTAPLQGRREASPGLRLGYVPQQASLDPTFPFTVKEVVAQGLASGPGRVRAAGAQMERVRVALEEVGLWDRAQRAFSELSGGQKQRVLLARATVQPVDLLLLDEPTAGVDHDAQERIRASLQRQVEAGTGVLLVTHNPTAWASLVTNWWLVDKGRVTQLEEAP